MKKSELISILALAYDLLPPNPTPKQVAKEMLRVVEKHGMMPPIIKKKITRPLTYSNSSTDTKTLVPGTFECVVHIAEWEDEEEL